MRIGVDLDNTMLCYDYLFHTLAAERGWISPVAAARKEAVRDAVRLLPDGDDKWQELQALAYGPRLGEAALFPDVETVFRIWRDAGHGCFIISHKTRCSGKGGYDLHAAARAFLEETSLLRKSLVPEGNIFFCPSREEKIRRIAETGCQVFVDDLIEVFSEPSFPEAVRKIHFAPDARALSPHDAVVCRSWRDIADYDPEVDAILARTGGSPPVRMKRLSGGRNSKVWKGESHNAAPVVVKRYHRDGRGRLGAESAAFDLLRRHGLHCVPEVLAVFPEQNTAIYSWIEGEPVATLSDTPEAVEPFAALVEALWHIGKSVSVHDTPFAAEACVSLEALKDQVSGRFTRLLEVPDGTDLVHVMREFLRNEAIPAWTRRIEAAEREYALMGRSPEQLLTDGERILSPSDFGCHNAIRTGDGGLAFVDFEYFGWDDPVKLVSDFLLHPGMRLTSGQKEYFHGRVMALFADTDAFRRFSALLPLFAVKWACILLNEFLPARSATRRFALATAPQEAMLEGQLRKARDMLRTTNLKV